MDAAVGRRSWAEVVLSLVVLAAGAAVFFTGASLSGNQGYSLVGPDMMPMVVGLGLAILGGWLLVESLRGGWRDAEPDDPAVRGDHAFLAGAFLWVAVGLGAQMALMKSAGFVVAAGVLFLCVARGFGSVRPVRDLLIGLLLGLAVFLFFVRFLNVSLPAGLLAPILRAAGV